MSAIIYALQEFARRMGLAITVYHTKDAPVASVTISADERSKYHITIVKVE